MKKLLRRAVRQVRHVRPTPAGSARGLVAEVYGQVERDFGMLAPPVALHSPAPEVLGAAWLTLRETLLAGTTRRQDREAVAAAISVANSCPYCVAVHSSTLHALAPGRDAAAIAAGQTELVADPALRQATAWAVAAEPMPLTAVAAAELVGVVVTFHYLNRMVNVFLGESPLPPELPAAARGPMGKVLGRVLRPRGTLAPGPSLRLVPEAVLPEDLNWAAGSPPVADAYAQATGAIEAAGRRTVPGPVRHLVADALDGWDGRPKGLSRAWVEEATAGLDAKLAPVAVLTLLTAMASYQVTPPDVAAFREVSPDDRALVEATAWASMAAARRLGERLWHWHLSATRRDLS